MKKIALVFAALAVCLSVLHGAPVASKEPTLTDDALASIKLPVPQNVNAKSYLGLTGGGSFAIAQIKARVIIIEIFNMYCGNCQREAPRVNELYQLINKDPNMKGKIKMIGIGVGNTPLEVEVFKKSYQITFPLFPDADYIIHEALGKERTPFFIAAKINADGSLTIFQTKRGGFQDPAQFLKQIAISSGV